MRLYFDNNATTPCAPEVLDALLPWLRDRCGNPSSTHPAGAETADALRAARSSVARLLGVLPRDLVFTSGGTESIATALAAALAARPDRPRVAASRVEHAAVLRTLEASGRELVLLDVDAAGRLDLERASAALDERCALVSVMWANNELGTVNDLAGIVARARAVGALVHVDAVQAAGKLPLDAAHLAPDYLSVSAHKLHGPQGAGALWIRPGAPFTPRQRGGPQEAGRRGGTENVPALVGFGRAAELARAWLAGPGPGELARARDAFEAALLDACAPAHVHARAAPRLPNTTSIRFEGVDGEALLALLASADVCASAGSACHAQARRPSHVLAAIGLGPEAAASTVRFSCSRYTRADEFEAGLERIADAVRTLRGA